MDQKVERYIQEHREEYVGLLQKYCRQPSQASTGEGIADMVSMIAEDIRRMLKVEPEIYPTSGNPVIYAFIPGESDRVYGVYGHYDVQPVEPLELWTRPPYSAEIADGDIWARGVADDKLTVASTICAAHAYLEVYGKLPCGLKMFFEGEEEIGSPHLGEFALAHADLLGCDGYKWETGTMDPGRPPEVFIGNKGLLYVEYHVRTAVMDAHSMYAAIVKNPALRLVKMLASMKDENDRILIDGFYDNVAEPTPADIQNMLEDEFDAQGFKEYLGLDGFVNDLEGLELLKKLYYMPTANICGFVSGHTGEGTKTVLPCKAMAKMDFRLVPGQEPDEILKLLRAHLDKHGFTDIEIVKLSGQPPFRSKPDSAFVKAVVRVLTQRFGKPALHHIIAGTSPTPFFCKEQGIPAAMFGCSPSKANVHAPNEHLPVENYINEILLSVDVLEELAKA